MELTVRDIAELVRGEVAGDGDVIIRGVAPFDNAGPDEITFAVTPGYKKRIVETKAGAVIVPLDISESEKVLVRVENPSLALAEVSARFHAVERPVVGVSQGAHVGKNFRYGNDVSVYPGVSIGDDVTLGDRVTVRACVVIENRAVIGDDVVLHPNVSILERCEIGSRVIIHAGSVIGSDGFGFAPHEGGYSKIPQTGIVRIDDDVEIGACNTIDRATFGKTWIKRGVKTDNLVHIAHNVVVGEDTVLVAQVGISGSVKIGNRAILAGQVGVAQHVSIGDRATIGPQSGVAKSVAEDQVMSGSPVMPHRLWLKVSSLLPKLPEMRKKVGELEKRIERLEKGSED
ncbi:MAG: UDP-3-O-(3-hydroxymyristoyl)glucosamine N-acyltransferase [Deltaproteobacteria bacterium]|nr:UDP-3-O-(3-hydroxymyristoyl)glucosamine N-acyltransferase [Deltaproteobacteria bacterium]MBW2170598.1 UDP-3-O-(3-hydroxymyristoyl)glucosamine N-acyltransferase [Deltaproteobacteria bacterium]MBW2259705.1 UDP-3-O-(3-hydroxymyristoyl)glucosamine N-acyltransferase [Deltaproteobacteria bacterium]